MNVIKKNYVSLMVWIFSLILIGFIIGTLTKSSVDAWYAPLNRSHLTPPNYLFGIVWSILYTTIGTSGWMIWRSNYFSELSVIKKLYSIQLFLNWSWTPLFFIYHLTSIALICLFLIVTVVAFIIFKTYRPLTTVSLLFIPYLFWLLFATYLNYYIWRYN